MKMRCRERFGNQRLRNRFHTCDHPSASCTTAEAVREAETALQAAVEPVLKRMQEMIKL